MKASRKRPRRRGVFGQSAVRHAERTVKKDTLAFERWVRLRGMDIEEAAGRLGLCARTLEGWKRRWLKDRIRVTARGRPARRIDKVERANVMALFGLMGPGVGLPTLQALFPGVARRELEDLLRRYRRVPLPCCASRG